MTFTQDKYRAGANNLPHSCICTFERTIIDFIDVVVLFCDLALMKISLELHYACQATNCDPTCLLLKIIFRRVQNVPLKSHISTFEAANVD